MRVKVFSATSAKFLGGRAPRPRLRLAKELAAGPFSQEAEDRAGVSRTAFNVAAAPGFCSLLSDSDEGPCGLSLGTGPNHRLRGLLGLTLPCQRLYGWKSEWS